MILAIPTWHVSNFSVLLKAGGLMPVAHQTSMVCTTPLGKILAKLMASSGTT